MKRFMATFPNEIKKLAGDRGGRLETRRDGRKCHDSWTIGGKDLVGKIIYSKKATG